MKLIKVQFVSVLLLGLLFVCNGAEVDNGKNVEQQAPSIITNHPTEETAKFVYNANDNATTKKETAGEPPSAAITPSAPAPDTVPAKNSTDKPVTEATTQPSAEPPTNLTTTPPPTTAPTTPTPTTEPTPTPPPTTAPTTPTPSTVPTPTPPPTTAPTTPPPTTPSPTTPSPTTPSPTTPSPSTTPAPSPIQPCRRFDAPSFIGGIVLTVGLIAIAFVIVKFLRNRHEQNYHTL